MRSLADGRLEPDNNPLERAIRPLTLRRSTWPFAASDEGGHRVAATACPIGAAQRPPRQGPSPSAETPRAAPERRGAAA